MKIEDIHIGDVLRVREWDDMLAEFRLDSDGCIALSKSYFAPNMRYLCGKTFTVDRMEPYLDTTLIHSAEKVENYDFTSNLANHTWSITSDMLEPLFEQNSVDESYEPIGIDELRDFLSFDTNEVRNEA